ncbi:MAG: molybdopterin-dependent oxidoreductase [Flavobacteriaceae bacterium]
MENRAASEHASYCRVCLNGCAIRVGIEDGKAVSVTGDKDNPIYHGFICVKGREQVRLLSDPRRLRHSLKRGRDGRLHPIPVDEAIGEIAERLAAIRDAHGPRAIAGYLGTAQTNAAATCSIYTAFVQALGTPMNFGASTIDKPGKKIGHALHGKWGAPPVGYDDPEVIMLVGSNPLITFTGFPYGNPGRWLNERLAGGTKLIVIDPRRTDVAKRAHLHIQAAPGHDAEIAAAILNVIIADRLYDRDFVECYTDGLEALAEKVKPFTPDAVAQMAGIEAREIVEAARLLSSTRRGYINAGTGPNMSGLGTLIEYLLIDIHTLCGYWLRAGDRVRQPGALAQPADAVAEVKKPGRAYGFGERLRVRGLAGTAAGMPTGALADEILTGGEGQVKALISCAGNPAGSWPDQEQAIAAMKSLDLLVQVDPWMSSTAKLADYVIAPKIWLEVPSTTQMLDQLSRFGVGYGLAEPYAQYTPALVEPPEGSDLIEDWQFFYRLAKAMGLQLNVSTLILPNPARAPLDMENEPTSDELLEWLSRDARVPLSEVKKHPGGAIFAEPPVIVRPGDPLNEHRLRLAVPEMMADLAALAPGNRRAEARPLRLLCRRMMHVYNTNFIGALPATARPYNPAFLSPEDMAAYDIGEGETIAIASDFGEIEAIAHTDESLRAGTVSISFGFGQLPGETADPHDAGSNTTRLLSMSAIYDRYSGQPRMSNVPVSIRRLAGRRKARPEAGVEDRPGA